MKNFYIIDGNSFAYRAYYALPTLTTKGGIEVNAVYGFFTMLNKIIKEKKPDFLAIAFDSPKPTFRHKLFEEYKIKRELMPESLQTQLKIIKNILKNTNISYYEIEGYEADDIIGAISQVVSKNKHVIILTGDKDMIQLVNKNINILRIGKNKEILLTPEVIKTEYGISSNQIIDVLSLMGDPSDNIPGVKGIGEKTAYKLIKEYNNIENLLLNIDSIKPERIKKLIKENIENIKLSKKLALLNVDLKILELIKFKEEECSLKNINFQKLDEEFLKYDFKSLISSKDILDKKITFKIRNNIKEIKNIREISNEIKENKIISLFFSGSDARTIEFVFLSTGENFYYMYGYNLTKFNDLLDEKEIITNSSKIIYKLFNGKNFNIFDISLMAYLLNPEKIYKDVSHIFNEYEKDVFLSYEDIVGKGTKKISIEFVDKKQKEKYVSMILEKSYELKEKLKEKLKNEKLEKVYYNIELPLSKVIAKMEKEGIKIDRTYLNILIKNTEKNIKILEKEIYKLAGTEFNINSPKQLSEILFVKLNLPKRKKIKTGQSTDNEVLKFLEPIHEIAGKILKYRSMIKLKTSFLEVINNFLDDNDKIYPAYHQNITSTGRLSSSNPNIQNIPIKEEESREIRKIFIPFSNEEIMIKADYSQIELRILAHFSNDDKLIKAFREGKDIHSLTAAEIFDIPIEKVKKEHRRVAKTINFGIIYGMSPHGLSKELRISHGEAENYIDKFFMTYPGVKKYQESAIKMAREKGYVETLFGRKRYISNINSKNKTVREFAERAAINAPIQGTSADIIKIAMILIDKEIERKNLYAKMVLQVHDELTFTVDKNKKEELKNIVKTHMENVVKLKVPLVVTIGEGENWYECG